MVLAALTWLNPATARAQTLAPSQTTDDEQGDTVILDLEFEGWAEAGSALVTARVAVVTDQTQTGMIQVRMKAITQAASGHTDWRMTRLLPATGGRGAALWQSTMEARMSPEELGRMERALKRYRASDTQTSFTVERVDFSPTLAELQAVRTDLRAQAYQQAARELEQLNAAFPHKHYRIGKITFGNQCAFIRAPLEQMLGNAAALPFGATGTSDPDEPGHVSLTARVKLVSNDREGGKSPPPRPSHGPTPPAGSTAPVTPNTAIPAPSPAKSR